MKDANFKNNNFIKREHGKKYKRREKILDQCWKETWTSQILYVLGFDIDQRSNN
jgi:hypothetical protein